MTLPRPLSILFVAGTLFPALSQTGCDIPKRPPLSDKMERPQYGGDELTSQASPLPLKTDPAAAELEVPTMPTDQDWDTWNAYYSNGKHIGFGHISAKRNATTPATSDELTSDKSSNDDVHYTINDQLLLTSGRATVAQILRHESIESSDGQLKSFNATQSIGPLATHFRGTVDHQELVITTRRGVQETIRKIAWEPSYRGLVGVEQSLRNRPLQAGEVRLLKTLLPVQHRVATVRLAGGKKASAPLLGGTTSELLETNGQIEVDGNYSELVLWTDDVGTTLKSYTEVLGLLAFRTDEATATAQVLSHACRRSGVSLQVNGVIERPQDAKRTAYIIKRVKPPRHAESSPEASPLEIPSVPGQAQRRIADDTIHVLASIDSPANVPDFVAVDLSVSDTDSKASGLIDFQSELVRRLHSAASITGLNERETAVEMARTVNDVLEVSPHSLGLTRASDVAQAGVADATGHAVLLAALLRASKIPARIAAGVVFADPAAKTMQYHAWTLAYVDGAWLPLDATLGGPAPSNRVALMHSAFDDQSAEADVLSLVKKLGELQIEIARSQY